MRLVPVSLSLVYVAPFVFPPFSPSLSSLSPIRFPSLPSRPRSFPGCIPPPSLLCSSLCNHPALSPRRNASHPSHLRPSYLPPQLEVDICLSPIPHTAATTLPLSTRLTRICWQCPSSCRYDYFSRFIHFPFSFPLSLPLSPSPPLPQRSCSLEFSPSIIPRSRRTLARSI